MRYTENLKLEGEVWRPIAGFEGRYEVSNFGRVMSYLRQGYDCVPCAKYAHLVRPRRSKNGYLSVQICGGGKQNQHCRSIHRLVAAAFLNLEDGMVVNHIDGDKTNNHVSNLEVVTYSDNSKHAIRTGLSKMPEREFKPIAVLRDGIEVKRFPSIKSACNALGLTSAGVCNTLAGRISNHRGYTFKYL